MQWQQLIYFKTVADYNSMNKAAAELLMTQPNLSKSIKGLEDELKLTLFVRNNKGVQLTEDGKKLYQYAVNVIEQMNIIENLSQHQTPKILSLSAFPSIIFSDLLKDFYDNYKDQNIKFILRTARIAEIVENICALRSELGILFINEFQKSQVFNLLENRQLEFNEFATDEWYAYVGPNSPLYEKEDVNIRELMKYTVLRAPDDQFSLITSYMKIDGICLKEEAKRVIYLEEEMSIVHFLQKTDAFTFGLKIREKDYKSFGIACKKIQRCNVKVTLGWVKRKKEKLSEEGKAFIRLIKQYM